MADDSALENALRQLKAWQPWIIHVHTVDGEMKPLKVPEKRTKWESVKQSLASYKWIRLEARNKRGEIVGTITDDQDGLGSFGDGIDLGGVSSVPKVVLALVKIVVLAQDTALKRDSDRMQIVMAHQTKLVESVVGKFANMQRTQMALLERISGLMMEAGDLDDDSASSGMVGPAVKALLEMRNEERAERGNGGKKSKAG